MQNNTLVKADSHHTTSQLPRVIAGPILRHCSEDCVTVWLVTSYACDPKLQLFDNAASPIEIADSDHHNHQFAIGKHAFVHLLKLSKPALLQADCYYYYDIALDQSQTSVATLCPELCYEQHNMFSFRYRNKLTKLAHGSCRKAHFDGDDALAALDQVLQNQQQETPDLILMTGDQVYVDDVAGPMLSAIHQVISLLGLHNESFEGAAVDDLSTLCREPQWYYRREELLPGVKANNALTEAFFEAKKKPVFTSVNAQNHLVALSEMLALYLLSWSARLWPMLDLKQAEITEEHTQQYANETALIERFRDSLGKVERVLAHIPSYMIFDDHDVTDDWNLTRGWEEQIYGHPFSKRIIGNALSAYFICQACGNPDKELAPLFEVFEAEMQADALPNYDKLTELVLEWDQWHYELSTSPPIHVLDTRTQRWRSESNKNKPSGLMDWEALCELQSKLIGQESVIMVSAAPVYGVKLIETIQRIFTFFGAALTVDAENWMAHRGTANVMLNIFRHMKTPPNFIILSGDVHYSFVYDVKLRFRRNSPRILQFTCSGIHNQFPATLLRWFDRLNTIFYDHKSPLNYLTKRRNMSIKQRKPDDRKGHLVNQCCLGILVLDDNGQAKSCQLLRANGTTTQFKENP